MDPERFPRRILIGLEPAETGTRAALAGLDLARWLGATVRAVHAVDLPPTFLPGEQQEELAALQAPAFAFARKRAARALEDARGRADAPASETEDMLHVVEGRPSRVVLETAERLGADLLVLGRHARQPLCDFGSTTRAVLARATVPVWVQIGPVLPLERVLIAVDFSEHSRRALRFGRRLAERLGASVRLLHAHCPPAIAYGGPEEELPGRTVVFAEERRAAEEHLARWFAAEDWGTVDAEPVFALGEAPRTIAEHAAKADLVVLGTHGRTGWSRFLLGSVAYAALRRSSKPVLVIPGAERMELLAPARAEGAREAAPRLSSNPAGA